MAVIVKICGVTRLTDGLAAANAGADAIGFMFYPPSKRNITPDAAAEIATSLPTHLLRVGVFVDPTESEVRDTLRRVPLNVLQFHGNEPPHLCLCFPELVVWKAFRIQNRESLQALSAYPEAAAWLLDAYVPNALGGTGAAFDWMIAREAATRGHPIILAGGLTPANVSEAVRSVRPYGVDVSSGVESAPGLKDPSLIQSFIRAAKSA